MNRKTFWKETTVLKKSILLTLVLAILITLSASTFSLFNITDSVVTSTFSTKIYDVCRANTALVPDTIEEPDFIENSSPWIFMAYNSSDVKNYDTLINVTLINPVLKGGESLAGLQVGLYAQDNPVPLSKVYFSGDTAKLFIPNHFLGDVAKNTSKILSLQFFYKGYSINENGYNPFVLGTTSFRAKVWGDNYLQNIIKNKNYWFYFRIYKRNEGNNEGKIKGVVCEKGEFESPLPNAAIDLPKILTINYHKQVGLVDAYMEISYDLNTYRYDFTNDVYILPDVIAIRNDGLPSSTLDVDYLKFNNVPYSGELPDRAHEGFIYRNFQTTVDGFQISIEFADSADSNANFTIYVGNE